MARKTWFGGPGRQEGSERVDCDCFHDLVITLMFCFQIALTPSGCKQLSNGFRNPKTWKPFCLSRIAFYLASNTFKHIIWVFPCVSQKKSPSKSPKTSGFPFKQWHIETATLSVRRRQRRFKSGRPASWPTQVAPDCARSARCKLYTLVTSWWYSLYICLHWWSVNNICIHIYIYIYIDKHIHIYEDFMIDIEWAFWWPQMFDQLQTSGTRRSDPRGPVLHGGRQGWEGEEREREREREVVDRVTESLSF